MESRKAISYIIVWMILFFVFWLIIQIDTDPYDWVAAENGKICYEVESVPATVKRKVFFDSKKMCKKYINKDFY